jgi:hypothetical protein
MLSELDEDREDVMVVGLAFEEISPAHMKVFIERYAVKYPISIVDVYAPPEDLPCHVDFLRPMSSPPTAPSQSSFWDR